MPHERPYQFKYRYLLVVLVFRFRHNMAPEDLTRDLQWTVDRLQCLRSSFSRQLILSQNRLRSVGDHAFDVAAACVWNNLPPTLTSDATCNSQEKSEAI